MKRDQRVWRQGGERRGGSGDKVVRGERRGKEGGEAPIRLKERKTGEKGVRQKTQEDCV